MQRLYDRTEKDENDCWNFKGALRSGYGAIKYKGKICGTHRVSFEIANGKIPDGLLVCHKCDNKKCVNPDHLFLGTYKDNMQDCLKKGRMVIPVTIERQFKKGDYPTNTPVPIEKAIEIKKAVFTREKQTLQSIADKFGVKVQYIKDISAGRILKDR